MKKHSLLRPAALILYPLSFIACFLLGAFVTKWSGAAEGQGLAAGAIVIYYAVLSSVIGTMVSFIVAYFSPSKLIAKINWLLLIVLLLMIAVLAYQIRQKKSEKDLKEPVHKQKTILPQNMIAWGSFTERTKNSSAPKAGLGQFKPRFEDNSVLYLYNPPHPDDHLPDAPIDSISFQLDGIRNPSIKSAPPYLVAEHMKLDYGILFFKVRTQSPYMLELELNKSQGKQCGLKKQKENLCIGRIS
jgi:hypothetical protein